jgi:hypothetical protein
LSFVLRAGLGGQHFIFILFYVILYRPTCSSTFVINTMTPFKLVRKRYVTKNTKKQFWVLKLPKFQINLYLRVEVVFKKFPSLKVDGSFICNVCSNDVYLNTKLCITLSVLGYFFQWSNLRSWKQIGEKEKWVIAVEHAINIRWNHQHICQKHFFTL